MELHTNPIWIRDQLEIERYRLSMDVQPRPVSEGLRRFWERFPVRPGKEDKDRQ